MHRKQRNIDQKMTFLLNQKIGILLKPLVHGFGRKFKRFSLLLNLEIGILLTRLVHGFGRNIGQENVFYDILKQKNAFLGHKNKKFKNSKN